MKNFSISRFVLFCLCLLATNLVGMTGAAYAQARPSSQPTSVDLGYIALAEVPSSGQVILTGTENAYFRVESVAWTSGGTPSFVTLTSPSMVGATFSHSDPLTIAFDWNISRPGAYGDALRFEIICADGDGCGGETSTLIVDFKALVDCLGVDAVCNPKGPTCTIDWNTQHYVFIPTEDFAASAGSALTQIIQKQGSGYSTFTIPLFDVLALSGMSDLFDVPEGCACTSEYPDVSFQRSSASASVSFFQWSSRTGQAVTIPTKTSPLYDATLVLPAQMTGTAVIGAGYVSIMFSNLAASPDLTLEYVGPSDPIDTNTIVYDGKALCVGSDWDMSIIRNPADGDSPPNLNLVAADVAPTP